MTVHGNYAALALYAAEAKTGGRFRDGTAFYVQHVHPHLMDDQPVLDAVRRRIGDEVVRTVAATGTTLDPADVTITEVTPDEFAAKWRELASPLTNPDPDEWVADLHHIVGHWAPAGTLRPLGGDVYECSTCERTFTLPDHDPERPLPACAACATTKERRP